MLVLDARKDPRHPKVIAMAKPMEEFIHSTEWPRKGKDDFALSTGETWVPGLDTQCTEDSAGFTTWDTTKWKKTHTLTKIDTFRPKSGTYTDGNPAVNPGATEDGETNCDDGVDHDCANGDTVCGEVLRRGRRPSSARPTRPPRRARRSPVRASEPRWPSPSSRRTTDRSGSRTG